MELPQTQKVKKDPKNGKERAGPSPGPLLLPFPASPVSRQVCTNFELHGTRYTTVVYFYLIYLFLSLTLPRVMLRLLLHAAKLSYS